MSKDLELLQHWKTNNEYGVVYIPEFVINELEQALIKKQEQEKVLDILKSKKYIPLDRLNPRFWNDKEIYDETVNYEFYLWLCENECEYVVKEERKLTRNEFDSIMEVLKCTNI